MKETAVSLFLVLVLSACSMPKAKNEESILYTDSIKFRTLIVETINQKEFQFSYESQKFFGQEYYVILNNDQRFNKLNDLYVRGRAVRVLSEKEIEEQKIIAHFKYVMLQMVGDSAYVYLHYSMRGEGLKGSFLFKDGQWEVNKVSFFDYK